MIQLLIAFAVLAAGALRPPQPQAAPPHEPLRILFLSATASNAKSTALQFIDGGAGVAAIAWPANEIGWFFLRSVGYQENHDGLAPDVPGGSVATVTPAAGGVTMVGADFRSWITQTTAGDVHSWLRDRGFANSANALANLADGRPLRVRWSASAKALIRTGVEVAPSEISFSKSGQHTEIRLWADGTCASPGDDLPLKNYADGDKLPSVTLLGWLDGAALPAPLPVDRAGVAVLRITARGQWRLAVAGVRLLEHDPDADAEVHVATVTFSNGGGAR